MLRGCFAIRNWDEDCAAYNIDEVPTISAFHKLADALQLVESIQFMSVDERQAMIKKAVATVKRRDDWRTVVNVLKQSL